MGIRHGDRKEEKTNGVNYSRPYKIHMMEKDDIVIAGISLGTSIMYSIWFI